MPDSDGDRRALALKQLRRVARAAPAHRLHMRSFCERDACETAYCLAGWAAIDPWFRAHTAIEDLFRIVDDPDGPEVIPRDMRGLFARLGRLMGITREDARRLFGCEIAGDDGPHSVTKTEVLANIDRLLAGEPALPYRAACRDGMSP